MSATETIFWLALIGSAWCIALTLYDHWRAMKDRELVMRARLYRAAAAARVAVQARRLHGDVWSRRARTVDDLVGTETAPDVEWRDWGV